MLEESSPLLCRYTNHSFIILTDYSKSYGCPDFKINPTRFLLKCSASHVRHLNVCWDAAVTWGAPTGRTAHVNIHFRVSKHG